MQKFELNTINDFIQRLHTNGFLKTGEFKNKPIYHLSTPCRFKIDKSVVKSLKDNYLSAEEVGGILWVRPTTVIDENIYIVDQVSFIRNSIEDTVYKDKTDRIRTKQDAYLPDHKLYNSELNKIFAANHLPIKFHTHPTRGHDILDKLILQQYQSETSEQDGYESSNTHQMGNYDLLMPRALIVGNRDLSEEIFIELYNGFISPVEFDQSKKAVQRENLQPNLIPIYKTCTRNPINKSAYMTITIGSDKP